MNLKMKKLKNGSYSLGMTAIVIAMVVIINLVMNEIPSKYTKFDVSEQKLFTVGEQTEEIVSGLEDDITIYLVAPGGSEDSTLLELLNRYESLSGHITVETKDPVLYPTFVSQYTSDTLEDNSIIVTSASHSKAINYTDIYQYDIDYTTYESTLSAFDGEGQITSAIEYVTSEDIPVMYTLEGHNEATLSSTMTDSIEKENIEIASLNLLTHDSVPEDAGILMINAPTSDLSEEEGQKILNYMQGGGKVLLMTGYSEEERPNLMALMEEYGITLVDGMIVEQDADYYVPNYQQYLLPIVNSSEITGDVSNRYILAPFASGIQTLEDVRDTLEIESLLTTSDQAFSKTDLNTESLAQTENDIAGPFDVGVAVTETLDQGETKFICFSSEYLMEDQVNSMVSGANSTLIAGALSWLSDHENSVSIESKSMSTENLTVAAASSNFWGIIIVALIPLSLLITGGIIWVKRRKK